MALRLRIVSEHRRALGSRSSVVFGVGGGSIGRSADNDWVLPDSSRFVSGRHARVKFRDGSWYIEDTSTNGTFLNDDDTPLGRRPPTPLHNGDMLRFGEYHVVVALDSGAGGADATAEQTGARLSASGEAELLGAASSNGLPSHLDISLTTSALFRKESSGNEPLQIGGAFGQAVALPFGKSAPQAQPAEDSDIIAARRMERLARIMRERELVAVSAGSNSSNVDLARGGLEAFCRGAGLDVANLSNDGATSMLQLAGRLLREALVGLKDLDATRAELRHQFRLDEPPGDLDEPFRMSAGTDDLLRSLLAAHESRRLDPVQWLRQAFEQSKKHQEGLGWASRAGFTEFIRQLDPKELEARFAHSGKRGLLGGTNNWELYGAFYRSLVEAPGDGGVPHTYGESFSAAYRSVNKPRQG
jgi:type VI secretion system FHA domain protein